MNKNSYVTAALFVVFVLLTVVYFNLDNTPDALVNINPTDLVGDVIAPVSEDVEEGEEDHADTEQNQGQMPQQQGNVEQPQNEGQAEEGGNAGNEGGAGSELGAGADATDTEVETQTTSRISSLRHEIELQRSERVSSLQGVIASADYDAMQTSEAMDQIQDMDRVENNSRLVETSIRGMGFSDVLIDATNLDNQEIIVWVEIDTMDDAPSRETIAAMTLLTGQQFGSRNRVSVNFTPVN